MLNLYKKKTRVKKSNPFPAITTYSNKKTSVAKPSTFENAFIAKISENNAAAVNKKFLDSKTVTKQNKKNQKQPDVKKETINKDVKKNTSKKAAAVVEKKPMKKDVNKDTSKKAVAVVEKKIMKKDINKDTSKKAAVVEKKPMKKDVNKDTSKKAAAVEKKIMKKNVNKDTSKKAAAAVEKKTMKKDVNKVASKKESKKTSLKEEVKENTSKKPVKKNKKKATYKRPVSHLTHYDVDTLAGLKEIVRVKIVNPFNITECLLDPAYALFSWKKYFQLHQYTKVQKIWSTLFLYIPELNTPAEITRYTKVTLFRNKDLATDFEFILSDMYNFVRILKEEEAKIALQKVPVMPVPVEPPDTTNNV